MARVTEEVLAGMKEWRLQHPTATFREIEQALDERLSKVRARMLEDMALASAAVDIQAASESERPVCAKCGTRLTSDGRKRQRLVTYYNQEITLERSHGVRPICGEGLFPPRR